MTYIFEEDETLGSGRSIKVKKLIKRNGRSGEIVVGRIKKLPIGKGFGYYPGDNSISLGGPNITDQDLDNLKKRI